MTSLFAQRLHRLRSLMTEKGIDTYIVPRSDEYLGEYVPARAQRLAWLTGFTGSAGFAIIQQDQAFVMSDGRYTIQLENQLDSDFFQVGNSVDTPLQSWLAKNINNNETVCLYSWAVSQSSMNELLQVSLDNNFAVNPVSTCLVDLIWDDQPSAPDSPVELFPENIAGLSFDQKLDNITNMIQSHRADCLFLTLSDSIAWLLNIRANDVPHIPVALSYFMVRHDGQAFWFIDENRVPDVVQDKLRPRVTIAKPEAMERFIDQDLKQQTILLDPKRTPYWFFQTFRENGNTIIEAKDPCIDTRACKTESEQQAMRQAHIRDGVSIVKFLKWLDETANSGQLTELSVEAQLNGYRAEHPEFRDTSFETIAGFNANGAIVHYRATPQTSQTITDPGILLIDSGAQYCDGTTDITRTIAIGTPSDDVKKHYTLVLKGHIALASSNFSRQTKGKVLDACARHFLLEEGLNYAHGTGHGVGCYLSVHEESASLSFRGEDILKPGMILSNEPGYYKEGAYGIRIENLVLVRERDDNTLYFETLTVAPIDKTLIDIKLLTKDEKSWLNNYHKTVFDTLRSVLSDQETVWLKNATSPI